MEVVGQDGLESLFDPALLRHNVKKAEEKYASLSKKDWYALRRRAKTDLFFLCTGPLNYDRLQIGLHGHLCKWLADNSDWRFKLILLPRSGFKTTVSTIADSIQLVLPDDIGDLRYPYNLGPDCRLLITHAVDDKAAAFLYEIAAHFTNNIDLMGLFPEMVPDRKICRLNKYEFELPKRTRRHKETTITASGVTASSQGGHFNFIKPDDIIGDKERDSAAAMERAVRWVNGIEPYFTDLHTDFLTFVGTHYGPGDIYEHIKERYGDQIRVYRRSMEEPDANGVLQPIMEGVTQRDLKRLKADKQLYATQYQNDPNTGLAKFQEKWLSKRFNWVNDYRISYQTTQLNPSRTRLLSYEKELDLDDCSIVFLHDPADGGFGGFCIVATDDRFNHFVLEAQQEDISPEEVVHKIFRLVPNYRPWTVGIESVLFSRLYEPWLNSEMRVRGSYFHVTPVTIGSSSKPARVSGLAPWLESGTIYFNEQKYSYDETHESSHLLYQLRRFGVVKQYHVLDALSMLPGLARAGVSRAQMKDDRRAVERKISNRDSRTGYSNIRLKRPA